MGRQLRLLKGGYIYININYVSTNHWKSFLETRFGAHCMVSCLDLNVIFIWIFIFVLWLFNNEPFQSLSDTPHICYALCDLHTNTTGKISHLNEGLISLWDRGHTDPTTVDPFSVAMTQTISSKSLLEL